MAKSMVNPRGFTAICDEYIEPSLSGKLAFMKTLGEEFFDFQITLHKCPLVTCRTDLNGQLALAPFLRSHVLEVAFDILPKTGNAQAHGQACSIWSVLVHGYRYDVRPADSSKLFRYLTFATAQIVIREINTFPDLENIPDETIRAVFQARGVVWLT